MSSLCEIRVLRHDPVRRARADVEEHLNAARARDVDGGVCNGAIV